MDGRAEGRLVDEASRGDSLAIEQLLARHLSGLEAFIAKRGVDLPRAKESAGDLVQSVCREVLERLGDERLEYRGEAEFKAWLYEAALFKIRNRRRFWRADRRDIGRERGTPGRGQSGDDCAHWTPTDPRPSPSEHAASIEERHGARALLEQLPDRYRRVIELAKLEGLDHAEIAARLEITPTASRMLLSRALARLATLARDRP